MKLKTKVILIIIAVLVIFGYVRILPIYKEYNGDSVYEGETIRLEVEEGDTASHVALKLVANDVIKNKYSFILKHKYNSEKYGEIKYGTYMIREGMNLDDILYTLTSTNGNADVVSVVIPEGFSAEMIGARLEENNLCTKEEFLTSIQQDSFDYEFISHIPDGNYKYKLEGFLFPSTYEFSYDMSAHVIADTMLSTFEREYKSQFDNYDDIFRIMTMASIIEREAVLDDERAVIAGVINNRVNSGMLLQIDATVVYAKSAGLYDMTVVTYEDLEVDSPYNTYKNKGLTPGPICNPGIKSVIAAANPASHTYLFYHTDEVKKDGSHIFTETFDDHVATMN